MGLQTESLKKKQEEQEKRRGRGESFQLEDGKNIVRILPRSMKYFSKDGDNDFAVRYLVHYNMFEEQGFKMIVCPQTFQKGCPICDLVEKSTDKVVVGRVRFRERYMFNVWDQKESKIKIFETGPKIYEEILKFVVNPEWGDLFGLEEGRMITIERIPKEKSGTGWVDYSIMPSPQVTNVQSLLPEDWDGVIDELENRIPTVFEKVELERLVACFARGVSPSTGKEAPSSQAASTVNVGTAQVAQPVSAPVPPIVNQASVPGAKKRGEPGCQPGPQPDPKFPAGALPFCFGVEYSPRLDKCKTCWTKPDCRTEYLRA